MKCFLDDLDRELLCREVIRKEIYDTIRTFDKNRTPGIDGLTVEFHLKNWDIIADDFVEIVKYMIDCKLLCTSERKWLI